MAARDNITMQLEATPQIGGSSVATHPTEEVTCARAVWESGCSGSIDMRNGLLIYAANRMRKWRRQVTICAATAVGRVALCETDIPGPERAVVSRNPAYLLRRFTDVVRACVCSFQSQRVYWVLGLELVKEGGAQGCG